jgi:hypothetical protein
MSTPRSTTTRNGRFAALAALSLAAAPAGTALAQHLGDIGLRVEAGEIRTASIASGGYGAEARVFAGAFGDTGIPWFTANPGYDALPGTFPTGVGARLGVRFTGPIRVWDGASFVPTSPDGALQGERLRISFSTANMTSADGPVSGFTLLVQSDGGWHKHLNMTLLAAPGAAAPDAGTYLVPLRVYATNAALVESEEFWLVLDANDSQESFDAALAAARAAMNPSACPSDLDGDGATSGSDLGLLLGNWGLAGTGDLDGTGTVTGADLGLLLGAWGACP